MKIPSADRGRHQDHLRIRKVSALFKFVITLLQYDVILLPEHKEDKMTDTKKTMQDYIASCPAYIRNNIENSKELTKQIGRAHV